MVDRWKRVLCSIWNLSFHNVKMVQAIGVHPTFKRTVSLSPPRYGLKTKYAIWFGFMAMRDFYFCEHETNTGMGDILCAVLRTFNVSWQHEVDSRVMNFHFSLMINGVHRRWANILDKVLMVSGNFCRKMLKWNWMEWIIFWTSCPLLVETNNVWRNFRLARITDRYKLVLVFCLFRIYWNNDLDHLQ